MPNSPRDLSALALALKPIIMGWIGSSLTGGSVSFPTYTIVAGTGLSGGGVLNPSSLSVTLNATAADSTITVAADSISVNQAYAFTWSQLHTFNLGVRIASGQTLQFGTDTALQRIGAGLLGPSSGTTLQSLSYSPGISGWQIRHDGTAEFENVRVRGELVSTVFKYQEVQATAGTFGIFKSASTLYSAFTTPSAINGTGTLLAKNSDQGISGSLFVNGDVLRIRSFVGSTIRDSWLQISGAPTAFADYTSYPVTLKSGSTSVTFAAATAVVDYGQNGNGLIAMSADGAMGNTNSIVIATHAGAPWTTQTTVALIGNMNSAYGTDAANYYGLGVGDYSTKNYLAYDTNGGFRLEAGGGAVKINANGVSVVPTAAVPDTLHGYTFDYASGTDIGGVYGIVTGTENSLTLTARTIAAHNAVASVQAGDIASVRGTVYLQAANSVGTATLSLYTTPSAYYMLMDSQYVEIRNRLQVKGFAGNGYVALISGDATHTGYLEWWSAAAVRQGYLGWGTGGHIDIAMEAGNYLNIAGGRVNSDFSNACKIRRTGSAQSLNNASYDVIVFDTEDYDGNSYANLGSFNTRLTVPTNGLYLINARISFASNATNIRGVYIRAQGTSYIAGRNQAAVNGDRTVMEVTCLQNLNAGEYVEMIAYQNSGGALNAEVLDHRSITFSIARMV